MLESILKFNKKNFYQDKVNAIGEAVRNYATLKLSKADSEAIARAKDHAQQTISSIILESGFTSKDNAYIALDKEFFTDKGLLDEESLSKLQREVVKHYGLQQLKWSFAGTTMQFTQITKRELKKQGIIYEELLPEELQKVKQEEKIKNYKGKEPNTYRAFLYSDGSVSETVLPEKLQVRFNNLKDQSGFSWESGYSPDNQVVKKDWITGFNKQGVWEKVITAPGERTHQPYSYSPRPIDFFTGTTSEITSGYKREHDSIGIIQAGDGTYLFDDLSFLYEDYEEYYYSITGEIYGAQKVDQKKSLEIVRKSLNEKGISTLSGVVLRQASKDAVKYYKTILADYVTDKTRFYSRNDTSLTKKLSDIRTVIEGKEVSNRIIADLHYLSKRGVTKEELEKNLTHKEESSMWEIPLHIFDQESDLETFLMLPFVREICEEEVADYLKDMHVQGMNVPEEKRNMLSNAVQNLMIGYKETFKYNPVKQIDIIRAAVEYLVNNKISPALKTKVTAEETLYSVIKKAAGMPGVKESFSAFIPAKSKGKYKDIFSEQGRSEWIREELEPVFPEETVKAVENALITIIVPAVLKKNFSYAVQNIFPLFTSIAESTGITPVEIIRHIEDVLLDKAETESLKRKRVFFEKTVKDIIKENSKADAPSVKGREKEMFQGDIVRIEWKPFSDDINLFKDDDLDAFLTSPLLTESGFKQEEAEEISEYIRLAITPGKTTALPWKDQVELSRGLINIIRGYEYQLKPFHIPLKDAMKALSDTILIKEEQKEKPAVDMPALNTVMKVARTRKRESVEIKEKDSFTTGSGENLESLIDYGIDAFLSSGLITGGGIPRKEAAKVYRYLKKLSIPENLKGTFSRAIVATLKNYGKTFAAGNITALDAVKAVALYIGGKAGKIPQKIQQPVQEILNTVSSPVLFPEDKTGKPDLGSDIPGTGTFNLLNQDDFNEFIKSDLFVASGLNPDKLNSIIQEYRKVYNQNNDQFRHLSTIPITYTENVTENPPEFLKDNVPPLHGIKNNVFNVGFVLKAFPGQVPMLTITKQGKKTLSNYRHQGEQGSVILENEKSTMQSQFLDTYQDEAEGTEYPYSFTSSYSRNYYKTVPSFSDKGQKKVFQPPVNKNMQTGFTQNKGDLTGKTYLTAKESTTANKGLSHFQRIEKNYYNDKKLLARSSSGSVPGKSSEGKKQGSKDDDNVIKQLSDDLVEEMKNKAKEEGL